MQQPYVNVTKENPTILILTVDSPCFISGSLFLVSLDFVPPDADSDSDQGNIGACP